MSCFTTKKKRSASKHKAEEMQIGSTCLICGGNDKSLHLQINETLAANPIGKIPDIKNATKAEMSNMYIPMTSSLIPKPSSREDQEKLNDFIAEAQAKNRDIKCSWTINGEVAKGFKPNGLTTTTVLTNVNNPAKNSNQAYLSIGDSDHVIGQGECKIIGTPCEEGNTLNSKFIAEPVDSEMVKIVELTDIFHNINKYSDVMSKDGYHEITLSKAKNANSQIESGEGFDFDWGGILTTVIDTIVSII